jgi:hypothetical protein
VTQRWKLERIAEIVLRAPLQWAMGDEINEKL